MEENLQKQCFHQSSFPQVILPAKSKPNRHCSVLNQTRFLTNAPSVRRCRKTQYECFVNIDKKQIFTMVHKFVCNLIDSDDMLKNILKSMKFGSQKNEETEKHQNLAHQYILAQKSLNQHLQPSSFNLLSDHPLQKPLQKNVLNSKTKDKPLKSCKKISIMFDSGFQDFSVENQGSLLFSQETIEGISSIEIEQQEFTLNLVEQIYEQPQPFLVNLSVCLMLKYLYFSKIKLTNKNACWILSIGTIIAYKIYYDEIVEGLVDSFAYILNIRKDEIINLQRHFLGVIDHQAIITNEQYHSVLYQIIKQKIN